MKKVIVLVALICVLAGGGWAFQSWSAWRVNAKTTQFNEDVDNLFFALQQYKERVGFLSRRQQRRSRQGACKAITPKNLIILVGRKQDLDSKGEFVDPWGTPLRIYFSGEGILVRFRRPQQTL